MIWGFCYSDAVLRALCQLYKRTVALKGKFRDRIEPQYEGFIL